MFFTELVIFAFGLCIGSFLNVIICRYSTGKGIGGRSHCMSCNKTLTWRELMPVVSYLAQNGACKNCKSKVSAQYPLVEMATAVLFVGIYQLLGLSWLALFAAVLWSLLVIIFVYDLRHKIIPDAIVYTFIFLSLILNIFYTYMHGGSWTDTIVAGPAVALPFVLIWLVSKGKWMGLGDGKLALGIGWMLGMGSGYAAVIIAFWIGAIIGLVLMAIQAGKLSMKSEIPLAPFLIVGVAIVFFNNVTFADLVNLFSFIQ